MIPVLQTDRLVLEPFTLDDASFILELVNQPAFLEHIGDRGVRTESDAREYLRTSALRSYAEHGYGPLKVSRREPREPIGLCGLIHRDTWDDVDVGYAFLPDAWGHGYALEAARAVMGYGLRELGLPRIVAICSLENEPSKRLLARLGLELQRMVKLEEEGSPIGFFVPTTPDAGETETTEWPSS